MHVCDLKMSFSSKYKFDGNFCFWNLLSWTKNPAGNSATLTQNFSPAITWPHRQLFLFDQNTFHISNESQNKDLVSNFFELVKRLQSLIFPILNSFHFLIGKAFPFNELVNSSKPTWVGIPGTVSNTGNFSFGDFKNFGPRNNNCGKTFRPISICSYVSWVQLSRNISLTNTVNIFSNFSNSAFHTSFPVFINAFDPLQSDWRMSATDGFYYVWQ